ncbi:FkbM family methyltransferase [Streptomyces boncukensis]|uniref:FkbM family methyltransferase n=1 Tax=Streptomyces boncukensis TaxID=2711219 RepID=A0A6G4X7G7_9ACTN|nr:FkbM family methyltransferase [Streptomyces boncukensis]NGO72611.1 FkbM family methyltransferase [Streptomyces boncukensis]
MRDLRELQLGAQRGYLRYAPPAWPGMAHLAKRVNHELREHPHRGIARTRWGDWLAVDTTDLIQRFLYIWGTWEPHMSAWLRRTLRPGDGYVDVGANIGYFSLLAAHLVGPGGRVVAVEASPSVHRRLVRHVEYNRRDSVRTVHAAVSSKPESVEFVLASDRNMGAAGIVPYEGQAKERFTVQARPLPELLENEEIAKARVIKIDVEGAEGGVVRGLTPVLDRLRPDAEISVEVTPSRMARLGESVDDLLRTMTAHGFHAYRLHNSYAPASYPAAMEHPLPPMRWRDPVANECDLVFSRRDVEAL